ncbi:MAG: LysR family transcriptional regulator, partial [Comamonadaceae bacterium]
VSGISRALSRLEKKLDTTLLRRTTRRTELTEEGQAFLARTRAILASIDEAEEHMAARRHQPAGRLRVNAATPFMLHAVVPLVPEFRRAYPQITLELDTDELNIDLLERRTDVAIRIGALRDSTLNARPLGTSRLRVLASPGYLAAHGRPKNVDELARQHTLLGFTQPESLNRWPLRGAHGDEWPITPGITASSGETVRQLALAGAGVACLSDFMTAADRSSGRLVQVLARDTADVRQPISAVYYRNTQLSARIACFLDFLVPRLGEGAAHAAP